MPAGFFLLAMAVVDVENNENLDWFAQHVKAIVYGDQMHAFISDKHSRVLKVIQNLFPNSHHSYCL